MKKTVLIFALLLSCIFIKAEAVDSYDIYLMIGQSNMAGRGELEKTDTTEALCGIYLLDTEGNPVEAMAPFNRFSTIRKDISLQGYSPANKFSELMHARTGRKILIVSNARGGSSIDHWLPDDKHGFLNEAVRRTRQAMRFGELKGILWHQGETDIQKGLSGYVEKFAKMVAALRDSLCYENLPLVIGQVGQWGWAPADDISKFNDSIVPEITRKINNCKSVFSHRLIRRYADKEHDPHFGRKAQMELGHRYADAMTELTESVYITKFKGAKMGAVSFTFDDGDLDHYLLVAPELEKRGYRGTFWIIGDKIDRGDSVRPRMTWSQLKEMSHRGHEISNHSFTHPKLVLMDQKDVRREIEMNDSAIERNVGKRPVTFCYPFNGYPGWIVNIAEENRVGSRTHQTGIGQQNNKSTPEMMQRWTDDIIMKGDWGVTMTHGITIGYDKWYAPNELWDFFDYVKSHEDKLWVATFCDVAEYEKIRDHTALSCEYGDSAILITTSSRLEPSLFNKPVTVAVKKDLVAGNVMAYRDTERVLVEEKDGVLLIEMYPNDKVRIEYDKCAH